MLRHVHCSERYSRRLERRLYASALRAGCPLCRVHKSCRFGIVFRYFAGRFIRLTLGTEGADVNYVMLTEYCSDNSRSAPAVKLRISPSAAYNLAVNVFAGRVSQSSAPRIISIPTSKLLTQKVYYVNICLMTDSFGWIARKNIGINHKEVH